MITTPLKYTTNLDRDPAKVTIPNLLHTADQQAHQVCVTVCRGSTRQVVDLSGAAITGYFIRADNTTVLIPGTVENNAAVCTLPAACYAKAGGFALLMKAEMGGVVHTIFHGVGALARSQSEALIDPEQVMPPLEELLAIITRAEQVADMTVETQTLPAGTEATASYRNGVLNLGIPRGDSGIQHSPDWSDNNPESPLHILNRTHWMESGDLTMIPETALTINEDGAFMLTEKPAGFPLPDTDCTVTWDGIDYTCKAHQATEGDVPVIVLGNAAVLGDDDTGEPFFLVLVGDEELGETEGLWGVAYEFTGASTATLKLNGPTEIIHRLDEKYLPTAVVAKSKEQPNLVNGDEVGSLRGLYTNENYVEGEHSLSFGMNVIAQSAYAVSFGVDNMSNGLASFAHGGQVIARGAYSHAEGWGCIADSAYSHAEGYGTQASGLTQHVEGKYNVIDSASKYLHIIGNGTGANKRSNAHTLDWSGNGWYAGTVECAGVILTSPSGARYQLTVTDDGTLTTAAL